MPAEMDFTDGELIARSLAGSDEAFGQLMHRHRGSAYRWALGICGDSHAADDVVQEAISRVYANLGKLQQAERFEPWYRRIVRNEALMALRSRALRSEQLTDDTTDGIDSNMNPENAIFRGDNGEAMIHRLGAKLSSQEKKVVDAFVLHQLLPAEIAEKYGMTMDNVYQLMSRSRMKMKEERAEHEIREYIREHRDHRAGEQMILSISSKSLRAAWRSCHNSFVCSLYSAMPAGARTKYSMTESMGLTSQAFRITIETGSIDSSGPYMYYWEPVFREGLANLGLSCEISGDGGAAPSPFMLSKGINQIRGAISEGRPSVVWGLNSAEFGLVYGYDDREQLLYADDGIGKRVTRFERLGRGDSEGLFVLSIGLGIDAIDPHVAVIRSLRMAVRHARTEKTFLGFAAGLQAYDYWAEAIRCGSVDPLGSAYCAKLFANARDYASRYLFGLSEKYAVFASIREQAVEAAGLYGELSTLLTDLHLPGSQGKETELLNQARQLDTECVGLLASLIDKLETVKAGETLWNKRPNQAR
ncbi:RNA polymerase sigma factor [Paenibacillus sp. BC26]|uniref:RNA polymerase sigma factor n=1 Tax=Paenibacillus sp. BC26 TaxID=1881032 RepID=UPI0008F43A5B|nr:sigma-70 family RNA polymerase sigma factor [Paenibacillus sp. BC26]SFT27319.1 RNA polymerase sigma factor, sigma-70 family [Paenibacillus sp. BC26]